MKICIDVLGGVKYQDAVLRTIPTTVGLGIFAEEFGDAIPFVKKCILKGFTFFRIQLIWSHRNHVYDDKDIPTLRRLAKAYQAIAAVNPLVKIELSPFCEYAASLKNIDKYCDIVKVIAPSCEVIASPVSGNSNYSKKYKNEIHGTHVSALNGRFNFSYDGNDAFNSDVKNVLKHMANAEYFFLWGAGCNCHKDENDKSRDYPATPMYLEALIYLLGDKGKCSLPKNSLWKPMSEKWKPVFICPTKAKEVVLKRDGKTIATMPYYGSYIDGRHRYYANIPGYKIGAVEVWINDKLYGYVDAGYRVNDYR